MINQPFAANRADGRMVWGLVSMALLLYACGIWLFRTGGWARWLAAVTGYAGLFLVCRISRLDMAALGLSRPGIRRSAKPALSVIVVGVLVYIALYHLTGGLFSDPRYRYGMGAALYASIVYVPIMTVCFEELAFRGVLYALLERLGGTRTAIVGSSILFAVWHVPTAPATTGSLGVAGMPVSATTAITVVVLTTIMGGLLFAYARHRTGSLLVPAAAHWVINAGAIMLSSAHR